MTQHLLSEVAHPDIRGMISSAHMISQPIGVLLGYIVGVSVNWNILFWFCAGKHSIFNPTFYAAGGGYKQTSLFLKPFHYWYCLS